MTTFSGISAAQSALVAARAGIDVAGQNMANLTTEGYTRQRVTLASAGPAARVGMMASTSFSAGQGVAVTGIARMANEMLDGRVRTTAASAGFTFVRASALSTLETSLNEPGANGLSAQLTDFWSSWSQLSNSAGSESAAAVVISEGTALAAQIKQGYTAVSTQWDSLRANTALQTGELNAAASQVAELNGMIRSALVAGTPANTMLDQRAALTSSIATLTGGTVNQNADGTVDVFLGGNLLVSGTTANEVTLTGASSIDGVSGGAGTGAGAGTRNAVQLEWAARPGAAIAVNGGEIAGALSMLAPSTSPSSSAGGTGGALASAANSYNALATALASQVNVLHRTGATPSGDTDKDFFAMAPSGPAALGLSIIPTGAQQIATGARGQGALDGSIADQISLINKKTGSPDSLWRATVTSIGATTKSELQQSVLADLAATSASANQLANSSVDLDEENVNLLMSQTAYNAAARVLSAMDEMLDTLINRTGLVGR
jgi:flagellar hook-associated protein 1 FlgK